MLIAVTCISGRCCYDTRLRPTCRSFPEQVYAEQSLQHPLIATRVDVADENLGEKLEELSFLERLLRCERDEAHEHIAAALWEAASEKEAVQRLDGLAAEYLPLWEAVSDSNSECDGRVDENRG